MTIYILTNVTSSLYNKPTGLKLAELGGFTPIRPSDLVNLHPERGDVLIRYGISSYPNKDLEFTIGWVFNKADDIRKASNKLIASRIMYTHSIDTPKIWTNKDLITEDDLPVLGRDQYHSRGSDIVFIDTMEKLRRSHKDYYSKFIPSIAEYRLHVFKGEPIRLSKKIPTEEESIIHNFENGYRFMDRWGREEGDLELETNVVIPAGLRAIEVFNLDFGAVDILISEGKTPYILEVNTAPRLNKYGRQLYVYYFRSKCMSEDDDPGKYAYTNYSRLRLNEGPLSNGLPITFRDIVKRRR